MPGSRLACPLYGLAHCIVWLYGLPIVWFGAPGTGQADDDGGAGNVAKNGLSGFLNAWNPPPTFLPPLNNLLDRWLEQHGNPKEYNDKRQKITALNLSHTKLYEQKILDEL